MGQELRRDALALVADLHAHAAIGGPQRKGDRAAARRELGGVAHQVPDHLLHPPAVGQQWRGLVPQVQRQPVAAFVERVLDHRRRLAQHRAGLDALARQRQLADVEPGHVQDVGDHPRLDRHVAVDRRQPLDEQLRRAVPLQHVRPAHDRVQRRAQLVRQHRDQVVLHAREPLGLAARHALAVEQFLALPRQQLALRDVRGHRHADAGLDRRRGGPFDRHRAAAAGAQRELRARPLAAEHRDEAARGDLVLAGDEVGQRAASDRLALVGAELQQRQHRGIGLQHGAVPGPQQADADRRLRVDGAELGLAAPHRLLGLAGAHQRLDGGHQHRRLDRVGEVGIGAGVQAADLVLVGEVGGGQVDDRQPEGAGLGA